MEDIMCPTCECDLEIDEYSDYESDGMSLYLTVDGHCPHCNAGYRWTEVYKFSHSMGLTRTR